MTPSPDPPVPVGPFAVTVDVSSLQISSTTFNITLALRHYVNGDWENVTEFYDGRVSLLGNSYSYSQLTSGDQYRVSMILPNNYIYEASSGTEPTTNLGNLIQWDFTPVADVTLTLSGKVKSV